MCPSDTWMEQGESERQRQTSQDALLGFAHGQAGSPDPSLTHGAQQEGELARGGGWNSHHIFPPPGPTWVLGLATECRRMIRDTRVPARMPY